MIAMQPTDSRLTVSLLYSTQLSHQEQSGTCDSSVVREERFCRTGKIRVTNTTVVLSLFKKYFETVERCQKISLPPTHSYK